MTTTSARTLADEYHGHHCHGAAGQLACRTGLAPLPTPADGHAYTDDGSDPGNCSVCHFNHPAAPLTAAQEAAAHAALPAVLDTMFDTRRVARTAVADGRGGWVYSSEHGPAAGHDERRVAGGRRHP